MIFLARASMSSTCFGPTGTMPSRTRAILDFFGGEIQERCLAVGHFSIVLLGNN